MSEPRSTAAPDYLAARLALLALRGSVGMNTVLEPDRVALDGAAATTSDAAARVLAARRKPVMCDGQAEGGVLAVQCLSLYAAEDDERRWFHLKRADDAERGGFMGWLADRYGSADHSVLATGRGDSLALPVSVVELWHADYEIRGVNFSGDDVQNPHHADLAEYREAKRLGARAVLRFDAPADNHSSMQMFSLPLRDTATESERGEVEQHFIDMARTFRMILALDPGSVEAESAQAESPWRRWQRRSMLDHRKAMKKLSAEMERFFAGRGLPPEVAAFIAECREHD